MVFHPRVLRIHGLVRTALSYMLIACPMCVASPAMAELILGAGASVTYEDNIVGLLAGGGGSAPSTGVPQGMTSTQSGARRFGPGAGSGSGASGSGASYVGAGSQSPGDLSVAVMTELGVGGRASDNFTFYALGFAERIDYQEFSEYDQAAAGASAGATLYLGDVFGATLSGSGETRRYENDPNRDGTEYSGTAGLKQFVTDDLWLRETAEYKTYGAAYQDFSYRGSAYRMAAGYDLTDDLFVKAGYRFQSLQYRDVAATSLRTRTASFGSGYDLTDRWSVWLDYERQTSYPSTSDVITRNNIFTLAIRWDY
jgi:hypothetical protein